MNPTQDFRSNIKKITKLQLLVSFITQNTMKNTDIAVFSEIMDYCKKRSSIFAYSSLFQKTYSIYLFISIRASLQLKDTPSQNVNQNTMAFNLHPQHKSHIWYHSLRSQKLTNFPHVDQGQKNSSHNESQQLSEYFEEEGDFSNLNPNQNKMEVQICNIQSINVQKSHKIYAEGQKLQFQVNTTYRSLLSDEIIEIPQEFVSSFFVKDNIAEHSDSDPRIRENILFYQMLMRLKQLEDAQIESDNKLKSETGIYLGYQNNTRGLFSYRQRKAGDRFIRIPKHRLFFAGWTRDSEMLLNLRIEDKYSEATLIVKRVIYLFERAFIKKEYMQQQFKYFRELFKRPWEAENQETDFQKLQYGFYENCFCQDILQDEILTLYLELLPKNYNYLPSMDNYFSVCFDGDHELMDKKRIEKAHIKEIFLTIEKLIKRQNLFRSWRDRYKSQDVIRFQKNFIRYFKIESISWCYHVLATRSFSAMLSSRKSREIAFLAPAIDLINHSDTPNCEWGYDPSTKSFYVETCKDIIAGEEFTIRYGSLSNFSLLMNYGMCVEENQQESSITICPYFQIAFKKDVGLAHITFKQLIFCFPWLINEKELFPGFQSKRKIKQKDLCLILYSRKIDKDLEKYVRQIIENFKNFLSQRNSNNPRKKQQFSWQNIQQKKIYIIYNILEFLKQEVNKVMKVKEANLKKMESKESQYAFKLKNYIILLNQQIQNCKRIINFIEDMKARKIRRLAKLLSLRWQDSESIQRKFS